MGSVEKGLGWFFVIILLLSIAFFGVGLWAFITLVQYWTAPGC